jgi:hypothetical protein
MDPGHAAICCGLKDVKINSVDKILNNNDNSLLKNYHTSKEYCYSQLAQHATKCLHHDQIH